MLKALLSQGRTTSTVLPSSVLYCIIVGALGTAFLKLYNASWFFLGEQSLMRVRSCLSL